MIIDEKGLARNLKYAYKHGGYTMTANDEQIIVYTDNWAIRVDWDKLPRKALATIVEHIGLLPQSSDALFIEDGSDPQAVMPETVGEDVAIWCREAETTERATIVPMAIQQVQLFQDEGLRVYGIRSDFLGIVSGSAIRDMAANVMDNTLANWSAEGEEITLKAWRPTALYYPKKSHKAVWEALERVDLHMEAVSDE